MVSRLVKEKGIFELIEAAVNITTSHPDVVFLMVGEALHSDVGIGRHIRRMIEDNGLTAKFVFTGFRADVARFYHAMDICILPSYREGMPRSIMEAMACGKPVVATDIAGCRDEVVDGETGLLVPVKDSEALADALLKLLRDSALAQRMGRAGQRRARELFDEDVICRRIVDAYHRLVEKKFGHSPKHETLIEPNHSQHFASDEKERTEEGRMLGYEKRPVSFFIKQVVDYLAAALLLVLLSPLLALMALLVKLDSSGPVFFRQIRAGRFNEPFSIFKFRTMIDGSEKISLEIAKNDPRITRIGRWLRVTSLDELPQLLNVVRGEMSLVGPRPLLPGTVQPAEVRRQCMKPGLSSYPVLFGRHGMSWDYRMELDIWYVEHWSLWLDLKIVLLTIPRIWARENVSESRFRPGSSPAMPLDEKNVR
jgi:lipopolysaccharide/colanic/teichoic acid biosynthesis glycosyltransferase